ncbi:hypothetical protein DDE18_00385 [Nocardioides gansuensis]|uniref:non-specific serine/threonine protein kinase n=1 Tax=Nocardioides gansuensis TaxID=2138300 RepID=A0A2T8FEM3_9ACTN|nr:protein kinase family protein [Nocardioides gansuensis]PVG84139.1 hypothetical protein DDE18_00385 [Nocardioides gansuensis]
MADSTRAGDVLGARYQLEDLLSEAGGGRFWRAYDRVLSRHVAVHLIPAGDERVPLMLDAAKRSARVVDRRILRVLDAECLDDRCYVVNEWGQGTSLDVMLSGEGPLAPRRAAWLVAEVAETIARAHAVGIAHGRLNPENVLVDVNGEVRLIGLEVDAALHGLPPGRLTADVVDLAGLLYAALTGRWAGVSGSRVPPALQDHGWVLRPRRVRAGIPRALDLLCDQVLNPAKDQPQRSEHDLTTAAGIATALGAFLGDRAPEPEPARAHRPLPPAPARWIVTAPEREPGQEAGPAPEPEPPAEPTPEPVDEPTVQAPVDPTLRVQLEAPTRAKPAAPEPGAGVVRDDRTLETPGSGSVRHGLPPRAGTPGQPVTAAELPTEAGMPVFHDDTDEVDWHRLRTEKPAPPPPLAEPEAKPLFAPDPPEGEPVRRPKPGSRAAAAPDYWPWEASGSGPLSASSAGSGSWPSWEETTGDVVPGRSWIRLAMLVALCMLVLVAAVAAYQLGTPDSPDPGTTNQGGVAPAEPRPLAGITADDFDPQGAEPKDEYPELVPLVLDGNDQTSWQTAGYDDNLGPAVPALKKGVGLILDLQGTKGVREVDVTTLGGPTSVSIYVTTQRPTTVDGLTPVGEQTGTGRLTFTLEEAVSGQFVTVWLTSLPQDQEDGRYRGHVAEVEVRG